MLSRIFASALLAASALLLGACGTRIYRTTPDAVTAAASQLVRAELGASDAAVMASRERAAAAAASVVHEAIAALDPADPQVVRTAAIRAVLDGEHDVATALLAAFDAAAPDGKLAWARVRTALDREDWTGARNLAWGYATAIKPMREQFMTLWYESWYRDPSFFQADVLTIEPGVQLTRLERLGGGSTITLKFKMEDVTVGAFKPNQTRLQSNYRAEIAADRLCELMDCGFEVPTNTEVRIERSDFLELYGLRNLESAGGYGANFSDLVWFTDEAGVEWLHGTLKQWVPGFGQFPIEFTEYWSHLVQRGQTRTRLEEMTFEQAIAGFRGENGNIGAIRSRAEDATALGLARQLSNLHVFDFLINNWDRYSGEFWGVNCQWNHGHFVSIDNGASFQSPSVGSAGSSTTWSRLGRVFVFSRSTWQRLNALDPMQTQALLFPPRVEHPDDNARFKLFLVRRQRLLNRVADEIADRGIDRVLIFD